MSTAITGAARLQPIGPHFVIAPALEGGDGPAGDGLVRALAAVPPVPGSLVVLAAAPDSAPVLRRELAALAQLATARGARELVLAASGLAALLPDGHRAVERVAAAAGLPVVAPDGLVAIEPDGTLVVNGPGGDGSWWRLAAPAEPRPIGAVWPPRPYEPTRPSEAAGADERPARPPEAAEVPGGPARPSAAPPVRTALPGGVEATRISAGFWITDAEQACHLPPEALGLVSAAPGSLVLAVGTPDRPHLPTSRLIAAVDALAPLPPGEPLLSAPWANPSALLGMATALAVHLDRDVVAAVGLPTRTPSGHSAVFLDGEGAPTWEPFLVGITVSPSRRRAVASGWRSHPSRWEQVAPAVFRALPGWVLEAVPAGLWLRPEGRPSRAAARLRRADPRRPLLTVGERGRPVPQEVWEFLGPLLDSLPPLGEAALGLLVHGETDQESAAIARFLARIHRLDWLGADVPAATPPAASPAEPAAEQPEQPVEDVPPTAADAIPAPPEPPAAIVAHGRPGPAPAEPAEAPAVAPAGAPGPIVLDSGACRGPSSTSRPEDREAVKALLGEHFQRLAGRAEQVSTRLPGLRSSLDDDLKPDLVAVLLHHQADAGGPVSRAALVSAARSGRPGRLTPVLDCLGSGLRRLPSHHGGVLLGAPVDVAALAAYLPGTTLTEPAPVTGLSSPEVELEASTEFGIWSATGRRTTLFGDPADEPEVVFPPGTRFTVLDVLPGDGARPSRVLLRELTTAAGAPDEQRAAELDRQARDRLRSWFERRDGVGPQDRRGLAQPGRYHCTPGVAAL